MRDPCPAAAEWRGWLSETLPPERAVTLSGHLDECPRCRELLEAVGDAPPGWAADSRDDPLDGTPGLAALVATLKADPDAAPTPALAGRAALPFLSESGADGELGRIGEYRVTGYLGSGGMGVVLRALDPTLGRPVALKVLAPALAGSDLARQRFVREARAAAAVVHDHVVTLHAVHPGGPDSGGLPYLVMQLLAGPTVQDRIDTEGSLPLRDAVRFAHQTASALAAAHAVGLVHRDIKPANLLLDGELPRVKVADFGLARARDDAGVTQDGVIAGTPEYMSPEQARGEPATASSDLYALGATLYATLAGRPPHAADNVLALLRHVSETPPIPLRKLNPSVPEWLEDLTMMLLEKDPARRPADAETVADWLARGLAHLETPRAAQKPRVPSRRRPVRALLAGFAALALLAAGLMVVTLRTPAGTLVVEVDDPNASVRIDGGEVAITGVGPQEVRLRPGDYTLTVGADGKKVAKEIVTVADGGRRVLSVRLEPEAVPAVAAVAPPAAPSDREQYRLLGLSGPPRSLAVARDGWLAVATEYPGDGGLIVYDERSQVRAAPNVRKIVGEPNRNFTPTLVLAWTPDGTGLLAGDNAGRLVLLDRAGAVIRTYPGHAAAVVSVAVSDDGTHVASGDQNGVLTVQEFCTGTLLWKQEAHIGSVHGVSFTRADGRRFVNTCGADGFFRSWDLIERTKGEIRVGTGDEPLLGMTAAPAPDRPAFFAGKRLYALTPRAEGGNGRIEALPLPNESDLTSVALSPDGKSVLATSFDGKAYLYDIASRASRVLAQSPCWARCGAFGPDGKSAFVGFGGRRDGNPPAYRDGPDVGVRRVTLDAPSGQKVTPPDPRATPDLVEYEPIQLSFTLDTPPRALAVSKDGFLAVGVLVNGQAGGLRVYQPDLRLHAVAEVGRVYSTAWTPDGESVLVGPGDGKLALFSRDGRLRRILEGHTGSVMAVAVSDDGTLAASGGKDGQMIFHEIRTGKVVWKTQAHTGMVTGVQFGHPSDPPAIHTCGGDGFYRVWSLTDRTSREVRVTEMNEHIWGMTAPPAAGAPPFFAANRLLTLSQRGGKLEVDTLPLPNEKLLMGVYLTRDRKSVLTTSVDGLTCLYDIATRTSRVLARSPTWATCAAISPDEKHAFLGFIQGHSGNLEYIGVRKIALDAPAKSDAAELARIQAELDRVMREVERERARLPMPRPAGPPEPANGMPLSKAPDLTQGEAAIRDLGGEPVALAVAPDGWLAVSAQPAGAGKGSVRLYDARCVPVATLPGVRAHALAWSPDGQSLFAAGGDGTVAQVDRKGLVTRTFAGHKGDVLAVAVSGDGTQLASGGAAGELIVHDTRHSTVAWRAAGAHAGAIRDVKFLDERGEGEEPITCGDDGYVRMWQSQGKQQVAARPAAGQPLRSVVTSSRISLFAATADGLLSLEKAPGDQPIARSIGLGDKTNLTGVTPSPDGASLLVTGSNGKAYLYEIERQRLSVAARTAGPALCSGFAPDGKSAYVGFGGPDAHVRRVELETPPKPAAAAGPRSDGNGIHSVRDFPSPVQAVAVAKDGTVVAGTRGDGPIRLFEEYLNLRPAIDPRALLKDVAAKAIAAGEFPGGVYALAWHPDGQTFVASVAGGWLARIDREGKLVGTYAGHDTTVYAMAFSADGKIFASGDMRGDLVIRDAVSGKEIWKTAAHRGPVTGVAFPDGDGREVCTTGHDGQYRLWDLKDRASEGFSISDGPVHGLAVRGGQKLDAFFAGRHLLAPRKGADGAFAAEALPLDSRDALTSVTLSPDGKTLLVTSADRTAYLYDITSRRARAVTAGDAPALCGAFAPDGRAIYVGFGDKAGGRDNTLRRLPVAVSNRPAAGASIGEAIRDSETAVTTLVVSPTGWLAAAGERDTRVRLYEDAHLSRGFVDVYDALNEPADTSTGAAPRGVWAVAWHPDGKSLAVAVTGGRVALVTPAGQLRGVVRHHKGTVTSLAYSADGKTLVAGDAEGRVAAHAAETQALLWSAEIHTGPVTGVRFALEDGKSVVQTCGQDGTFQVNAAGDGGRVRRHEVGGPVAAMAAPWAGTEQPLLVTAKSVFPAPGPDGRSDERASFADGKGTLTAAVTTPDGLSVLVAVGNVLRRYTDRGRQSSAPTSSPACRARSVAVSPDGRYALVGFGGCFEEGRRHEEGPDCVIRRVALTPPAAPKASADDPDERREFRTAVTSLAVAPDGTLAAASAGDGRVRLYADGQRLTSELDPRQSLGQASRDSGGVHALAWDSQGETLAAGLPGGVVARVSRAGLLRGKYAGLGDTVTALAFSPDGRYLAAADAAGTLVVFNTLSGSELWRQAAHQGRVTGVRIDAEPGHLVVRTCGEDGTFQSWAMVEDSRGRDWKLFENDRVGPQEIVGGIRGMSAPPAGSTLPLLASDRLLALVRAGDRVKAEALVLGADTGALRAVALSPDRTTALVAEQAGSVWVYDVLTRNARQIVSSKAGVAVSVAFSPDGRVAYVGSGGAVDNCVIRRISLGVTTRDARAEGPGRHVIAGFQGAVSALAVAADGTLAVGDEAEPVVRLYRDGLTAAGAIDVTAALKDVRVLDPRRSYMGVYALAWHPDGKTLVAGLGDGLVAHLTRDGRLVGVFAGREIAVQAVAFSADGKWLASGDSHGKLMVHDAATRAERWRAQAHVVDIAEVRFDQKDGEWRVLSRGGRGERAVWDALSGKRLAGTPIDPKFEGMIPPVPVGQEDKLDPSAGVRSPDGGSTLRVQGNQAFLCDPVSGGSRSLVASESCWARVAAFSPDGRFAYVGFGGRYVGNRREYEHGPDCAVRRVPVAPPAAKAPPAPKVGVPAPELTIRDFAAPVSALAVSKDGWLVVGTGMRKPKADGRVVVYDDAGRAKAHVAVRESFRPHNGAATGSGQWVDDVSALAWHPDGQSFALATPGEGGWLASFQREGGRNRRYKGGSAGVTSIAYSPDGNYLASGRTDGTLMVHSVESGHEVWTVPKAHAGPVSGVAWNVSAEGPLVLTVGGDGHLRTWSLRGRRMEADVGVTGGPLNGLAVPARAGADPFFAAERLRTLAPPAPGAGPRGIVTLPPENRDVITAVSVTPNGRRVLAACEDGRAYLYHPRTDRWAVVAQDASPSTAVAITPDGKFGYVGYAGAEGSVRKVALEGVAPD